MRTDKPPFNDVRVRRAISHGVNRQAILDAVFIKGEPSPAISREVPEWSPRIDQLAPGARYSGNGKRSIRRVDDRYRTVNGSKPCRERAQKNWSVKTERDRTAPCNRATIRNCSRRWPRASMHGYAQVPSKFCRRSSHFGKSYISPPTQPHRFGTQDEQRSSDGGVGLAYPAPCVASARASTQQNLNRALSQEGARTEAVEEQSGDSQLTHLTTMRR